MYGRGEKKNRTARDYSDCMGEETRKTGQLEIIVIVNKECKTSLVVSYHFTITDSDT